MQTETEPLADAVLSLIRSNSRELYRYTVATDHGSQMLDGVELLEAAVDDPSVMPSLGITVPTSQETYAVAHKALASAILVIGCADDSAGFIGDACRGLIELHARAAAAAAVPPIKLAEWMYLFHFNERVDYFRLDPVAYAPALGEKGMARLRALVEEFRAEIAATPLPAEAHYDSREFLLNWFDQRFAVLERDHEAIIRTHLHDGSVAAWHCDVSVAFEEIEEFDLAITWAESATLFNREWQSYTASERWWALVEQHRPDDLPRLARVIFERWPTAHAGARLVEATGAETIDEVLGVLETVPDELVRFHLDCLDAPVAAWQAAHRLEVTNSLVWKPLAQAYLQVDAVEALRVLVALAASTLTEAKTRTYRPAARELADLRNLALVAGADALAVVDGTIADLRDMYRRRPSLMKAFDAAGLP